MIEKRIEQLKQDTETLLLAHFYEESDIQSVADHIGDSLKLAQWGQKSKASTILMAGVVFMAESIKILSPEKTVLVPDLNAGCSLVEHSPYDKYLQWRKDNPTGICITYINSSAAVKSISDVICTSSNAEKIVNTIPKDRPILFGPDKNLGRYLAGKSGREFKLWPGACEVHVLFSSKKLFVLKKEHPDAVVIAHPECMEEVLQYADVIGSTSRLLEEVEKNPAKKFIVATEDGILHNMREMRPDATILQAPAEGTCACNQCPYMKLNNLEKIENAIKNKLPEVTLDEELRKKALIPLQRMMDITDGKPVTWPDRFEI